MKKEEIFEYVKKQYGTVPEYLWAQSPDNAVLRHKNGKWYAVVMTVEKSKLGLEGKDPVDIRFQCLSPAKKYKLYKSSINKRAPVPVPGKKVRGRESQTFFHLGSFSYHPISFYISY